MTDAPKMIFEQDAVRRERDAFCAGMHYQITAARMTPREAEQYADIANRRYPMPSKTVPREVTEVQKVHGAPVTFRCINGKIEGNDFGWAGKSYTVTPERVKLWADLFARPTEEVDADA